MASLAAFCKSHGLSLSFPVPHDTLCLWIAASAESLSHKSIRTYLHGIGTMHVMFGHPNPVENADVVWRAYLGAKRLQGGEAAVEQRLPITVELLRHLERWQDVSTVSGRLLRAAMWLGTCGLLRAGEFTVRDKNSCILRRRNLSFHADDGSVRCASALDIAYMRLKLDRSKTDQDGRGSRVVVSHPIAVHAMRAYLDAQRPLLPNDPLLLASDGSTLTHASLMQGTRALLVAAGVEGVERYKGHSFRRGGATSLHLAGLPDSVIKVMGRWRSFTFATYVDTPVQTLVQAGRKMAGTSALGKSVTFAAHQFESWAKPIWEKDPA